MKKLGRLALVAAIIFLDFTALDDITTGSEIDLTLEHLTLATTFPILGYFFGLFFGGTLFKTQRSFAKLTPLHEYHVHHDLAGSVLVASAFFIKPLWLAIITGGFGLGLVIHHVIFEGFVFISKYSKDHLHRQLKR